jgi:hypothetical protein
MQAVKAAVTGLPTTGANVFRSRVDPLERKELPALIVRWPQATEDISADQFPAPRITDRTLRIEVAAVVATKNEFDADLIQIRLEVETALAMPIVGPWKHITLRRVDFMLTGTGEKPTGEASLLYEARYFVVENAPGTAL